MIKLDAKFYGEIRKAKDNSLVPDDQYVVFLAKDNAFAKLLPLYLIECRTQHCDKAQLDAVQAMIDRVNAWREANPDKLKTPDAEGERMLTVENWGEKDIRNKK